MSIQPGWYPVCDRGSPNAQPLSPSLKELWRDKLADRSPDEMADGLPIKQVAGIQLAGGIEDAFDGAHGSDAVLAEHQAQEGFL